MKNITNWIIVILALICTVVLIRSCSQSKDNDALTERLKLEETKKDTLRTVVDPKTGLADVSKGSYVGSDEVTKQFLKENDLELAKLAKNNKAAIITKTVFKHDTTVVTVRDTVHDTRIADIVTPYYESHIVSGPEHTTESLIVKDDLTFYLGPDNRLHAKHSIPDNMLKTTELNSFFIENKQKKKNGKWIGGILLGAAAAYFITK